MRTVRLGWATGPKLFKNPLERAFAVEWRQNSFVQFACVTAFGSDATGLNDGVAIQLNTAIIHLGNIMSDPGHAVIWEGPCAWQKLFLLDVTLCGSRFDQQSVLGWQGDVALRHAGSD